MYDNSTCNILREAFGVNFKLEAHLVEYPPSVFLSDPPGIIMKNPPQLAVIKHEEVGVLVWVNQRVKDCGYSYPLYFGGPFTFWTVCDHCQLMIDNREEGYEKKFIDFEKEFCDKELSIIIGEEVDDEKYSEVERDNPELTKSISIKCLKVINKPFDDIWRNIFSLCERIGVTSLRLMNREKGYKEIKKEDKVKD